MTARADLHCHSSASRSPSSASQRALGLPECATPPEEVYELAKRRGMDFVTITDHDTIDGVLEIADRAGRLRVRGADGRVPGEPQAVHVLCLGITPDDHEWLQEHARRRRGRRRLPARARDRLRARPPLLRGRGAADRRATAAASPSCSAPGRSATAPARPSSTSPACDLRRDARRHRRRRLRRPRGRRHRAHVDRDARAPPRPRSSSATCAPAASWRAATRARPPSGRTPRWRSPSARSAAATTDAAPDPAAVLRMVERVMSEGDARSGAIGADLEPADARALLRAWLDAVELDLSEAELLGLLQSDGVPPRGPVPARPPPPRAPAAGGGRRRARAGGERGPATGRAPRTGVFDACVAAVPYVPAAAFLGREKRQARGRARGRARVALVADGIGSVHGVTRTLAEIARARRARLRGRGHRHGPGRRPPPQRRRRGRRCPSRRTSPSASPGLPAVVEAVAEGRYDLLHLCLARARSA